MDFLFVVFIVLGRVLLPKALIIRSTNLIIWSCILIKLKFSIGCNLCFSGCQVYRRPAISAASYVVLLATISQYKEKMYVSSWLGRPVINYTSTKMAFDNSALCQSYKFIVFLWWFCDVMYMHMLCYSSWQLSSTTTKFYFSCLLRVACEDGCQNIFHEVLFEILLGWLIRKAILDNNF